MRSLAEKGGCSWHVLNINDDKDRLENIVTHPQLHKSIIAIKQKNFKEVFDFTLLTTKEVLSEMNKLDQHKSKTGISISLLNIRIIAKFVLLYWQTYSTPASETEIFQIN